MSNLGYMTESTNVANEDNLWYSFFLIYSISALYLFIIYYYSQVLFTQLRFKKYSSNHDQQIQHHNKCLEYQYICNTWKKTNLT